MAQSPSPADGHRISMSNEYLYRAITPQFDAMLLQQSLESSGHAVHELGERLHRLEVASPHRLTNRSVDQIHLAPGNGQRSGDGAPPGGVAIRRRQSPGQVAGVLHEFHLATGGEAGERELVQRWQAQPGRRRGLHTREGLRLHVGSAWCEGKMTGNRGYRRHLRSLGHPSESHPEGTASPGDDRRRGPPSGASLACSSRCSAFAGSRTGGNVVRPVHSRGWTATLAAAAWWPHAPGGGEAPWPPWPPTMPCSTKDSRFSFRSPPPGEGWLRWTGGQPS